MAGRERRLERSEWLMRRDLEEAGADLRNARLMGGLTLRDVAARVNVSPSVILDTERGRGPGPRPAALAVHAAAVGMRARIQVYPDGEPLRDAAQLALLRAFIERLPAGSRLLVEQPISHDSNDRRAFDAVLLLLGCRCAVEVITRFHDCQAQLRGLHLKQRDGAVERMIVVAKAIRHNRRALSSAWDSVRTTFPPGTRAVMRALVAGEDPGSNGIVFL